MPRTSLPPQGGSLLVLLEHQRAALAQVAAGTPLADALKYFALNAENSLAGQVRISILFLDSDRRRLRYGIAPSLPDAYNQAIDGGEIGPRAGSCGTAAFTGEPVFVDDIANSPLWEGYCDLALSHGLRACSSLPILDLEGKVQGTVAFYYPEPQTPPASDLEWLALTAQTVTLALDRLHADQALRAAEVHYRQIFNSAKDFAIIGTDLDGIVTNWSEGARHLLGWQAEEIVGTGVQRIFTPEDQESGQPEKEMTCALAQGYAQDERWHVRKSGERFWGVGQLTPLKDDVGRVVGFVKILCDRSQQKRTEASLQALTADLEQQVAERTRERDRIWRNSMDLLIAIAPDGTVQAINPASFSTIGYMPSEVRGRHVHLFVHADDLDATLATIARAKQAPIDTFEVRLRHKDGSYRWFSWRATSESGVVYANGRDITVEKRQAEQLSHANEARMNLALEAGEMSAWELQPRSGALYWLYGTPAISGIPLDSGPVAFSMAEYMRYVHPDDRDVLARAMEEAGSGGNAPRTEFRILRDDGSLHWVESRGRTLKDESGVISKIVGVTVNITRRKRIEEDLKFLARASAELAELTDPQTTLDRLAFLAVPHFADWCTIDLLQEDGALKRVATAHINPEKVQLGHELYRRFPPDPSRSYGVWHVLRTGQSQHVREISSELLERAMSNAERRGIVNELGFRSYIAVPLLAHGKILGVVSFIAAESGRLYESEDLALAEDLARRAAVAIENAELYRTLRETDQAKDVFLATLAHELRNPLAALVSALSLLGLASDDKRRVDECVKLMARQSTQLTRLVDDLMDLSRITTGKIALKKEATSLAGILNNAIETSRPLLEAAQHQLHVNLPGTPTELFADPVRLGQVFSNLLTNAAKFTAPGGAIYVTLESTAAEFIVRVRDTGVGIPPSMLKTIFNMFAQITHPRERGHNGLGIGLSLVEGLVKLHDGQVEAFSQGLEQGSEFVVTLPKANCEPQTPGAHGSLALAGGSTPKGRRVLLVDDNVDAANATADIIRVLGNEVHVVHDGLKAVEAAADLKPDAVILDIGLPDIDGYEVARRIRCLPGIRRSLVLIALTGWGQEDDRQRAAEAGFDHYWVKPVGLERLKEMTILL